jgi:hypothetical protein
MRNILVGLALLLQVSHLSKPIEASEGILVHDDSSTPPNPTENNAVLQTPENLNTVADADEYDERTLLDTFGEAAKHFLTQKVIPETNPECKWDWRYVRCEPFCFCDFSPKRGDFHLGRCCRRRQETLNCTLEQRPSANPVQLVIQRFVQGTQLVINAAEQKTKQGYEKLQASVCDKLPEMDCSQGVPMLAWQERALCRHMIPSCPETSRTLETLETVKEPEIRTLETNTNLLEVDSITATDTIELGETGQSDENTPELPHVDAPKGDHDFERGAQQ